MDEKLREWLGPALNDAGTVLTVQLPEPFKLGETVVSEISLSEPTVAQVEEATKKTGLAQDIAMVAIVGKVPERAVRLLPVSEFQKATRFLLSFTQAGPLNGGDSSGS